MVTLAFLASVRPWPGTGAKYAMAAWPAIERAAAAGRFDAVIHAGDFAYDMDLENGH